jgi:dethiobiotin synthase
MRGRAAFVTGTDTGVGKTWVSASLARHWSGEGHRVAALKVAETGCLADGQRLVGEDDEALVAAAGGWQPERCRYLFKPAVAPGVAADDLGITIDLERIVRQVDQLRAVSDRVLVEGAGGWLVPMGEGRTIEDLAQCLALPVLLVARAGLGTINHTALTVRAIRGAGLHATAVLLSVKPHDDPALALRNQTELERFLDVPVVPIDAARLPAAASRIAALL